MDDGWFILSYSLCSFVCWKYSYPILLLKSFPNKMCKTEQRFWGLDMSGKMTRGNNGVTRPSEFLSSPRTKGHVGDPRAWDREGESKLFSQDVHCIMSVIVLWRSFPAQEVTSPHWLPELLVTQTQQQRSLVSVHSTLYLWAQAQSSGQGHYSFSYMVLFWAVIL